MYLGTSATDWPPTLNSLHRNRKKKGFPKRELPFNFRAPRKNLNPALRAGILACSTTTCQADVYGARLRLRDGEEGVIVRPPVGVGSTMANAMVGLLQIDQAPCHSGSQVVLSDQQIPPPFAIPPINPRKKSGVAIFESVSAYEPFPPPHFPHDDRDFPLLVFFARLWCTRD